MQKPGRQPYELCVSHLAMCCLKPHMSRMYIDKRILQWSSVFPVIRKIQLKGCQPTNGILNVNDSFPDWRKKLLVQDANELLAKAPMGANHLSKDRVLENTWIKFRLHIFPSHIVMWMVHEWFNHLAARWHPRLRCQTIEAARESSADIASKISWIRLLNTNIRQQFQSQPWLQNTFLRTSPLVTVAN